MSAISNIASTTGASAATETATDYTLPTKTLTQDDFLKLLVAKLSSQDPLNPTQDTEFISQMAQFSSLEQSKSMQSDIASLRTEQQITQANSLIGRTVELDTGAGAAAGGTVSAVTMQDGTPLVIVNGQAYGLDQITTITAGAQ